MNNFIEELSELLKKYNASISMETTPDSLLHDNHELQIKQDDEIIFKANADNEIINHQSLGVLK